MSFMSEQKEEAPLFEEDTGEYIIYVIDTETTGLDADKHDIIEISASRFRLSDPAKVEQMTWYLKPLSPETMDQEALDINKHKREDLLHLTDFGKETYKKPEEVIVDIENWVMEDRMSAMDRFVCGQNVTFDTVRMKKLWKKLKSSSTFPFDFTNDDRIFDTKHFAGAIDLLLGRRRRYYNLGNLVKAFGVKKRKAHRAEDDVAMTLDLMVAMLSPLIKVAKESFQENYLDVDE